MPERIQRRRVAGAKMPEGAIYVGRPSRWGNPWRVGAGTIDGVTVWTVAEGVNAWSTPFMFKTDAASVAVHYYRHWIAGAIRVKPDFCEPLRGHDLACWCPLDQPCHADVLLELANG